MGGRFVCGIGLQGEAWKQVKERVDALTDVPFKLVLVFPIYPDNSLSGIPLAIPGHFSSIFDQIILADPTIDYATRIAPTLLVVPSQPHHVFARIQHSVVKVPMTRIALYSTRACQSGGYIIFSLATTVGCHASSSLAPPRGKTGADFSSRAPPRRTRVGFTCKAAQPRPPSNMGSHQLLYLIVVRVTAHRVAKIH